VKKEKEEVEVAFLSALGESSSESLVSFSDGIGECGCGREGRKGE